MLKDQIYKTQFSEDDSLLGRSNAHVTILEYGDFECPYSAMARPVLESLVDEYPDAIQLVFRHFPINSAHRQAALQRRQNQQGRRASFGKCTICSLRIRINFSLKIYAVWRG
ncbi:MAG TPA: thioredoxin domain-containing protein [Anaerolineales bacterium]|nr:thioredoxin domain-containing protein [Anaerolineales bacterium]